MRVILSSDAADDLKKMLKELKTNKGVSATPSEVASWIVRDFGANHFKSSRPDMAKAFTNLSKLVRENLKKSASNEELIAALRESLAASVMNKTPRVRTQSKGDSAIVSNVDLKTDTQEKGSQ